MDPIDQIPHVLACDVGNTAIHFAHVQGETVGDVHTFRLGETVGLGKALAELWEQIPTSRRIAAAGVTPAGLKTLEAAVAEAIDEPVLLIGRDLPRPIQAELAKPDRIGVDRLCAAAAAFDHLGAACVVADFGTAITVDCVNDQGVFLGGAILPGLEMSAHSLHAGTAQLPEVELSEPDWVFGRNTREAIIGGLVFGARGALRELVEAYATYLGSWPAVIVTGGDARLVCGDPNTSELVQAIVPELALRGVALAYYKTLTI